MRSIVPVPIMKSKKVSAFLSIEDELYPFILSLKVAGLYFDPEPDDNKVGDSVTDLKARKTVGFRGYLSRLYCYVALLIQWFSFARSVAAFFPVGLADISMSVIMMSWSLQCALCSTILIISCQTRKFKIFFKYLDDLFGDPMAEEIGCGFRRPRLCLKLATLIGWTLVVANCTLLGTTMFGLLPLSKTVVPNIIHVFNYERWSVYLVTITNIYVVPAWIFPITFVVLISRYIISQFNQCQICLNDQIDASNGEFPEKLPELRLRFTKMFHAVELINGIFKWLLGVCFVTSIFLMCFLSFKLINSPLDISTIIANSYFFATGLCLVLVLSITSYNVNDAAHCFSGDIYRVGTKNATNEQLGQLNMFMIQQTCTSIGYTLMDFFVIKRDFLLSLIGIYSTYFFLLLQFNIE